MDTTRWRVLEASKQSGGLGFGKLSSPSLPIAKSTLGGWHFQGHCQTAIPRLMQSLLVKDSQVSTHIHQYKISCYHSATFREGLKTLPDGSKVFTAALYSI
jgi:hypothetical protein